jgi:hypothetical protein
MSTGNHSNPPGNMRIGMYIPFTRREAKINMMELLSQE